MSWAVMISSSSESMKSISLSASIGCIRAFQLRRKIIDDSQMQRGCIIDNCWPGLAGKQLDNWNWTQYCQINFPFSLVTHLLPSLVLFTRMFLTSLQLIRIRELLWWASTKPANGSCVRQAESNEPLGSTSWEQHPNSNISSRRNNALSKASRFSESRWFISWEAFINGPYFLCTMKKNEGNPYTQLCLQKGENDGEGRLKALRDKYRGK